MEMTDEATPTEQRIDAKLDKALEQRDGIKILFDRAITVRDAALAQVRETDDDNDVLQQQVSDLREALEAILGGLLNHEDGFNTAEYKEVVVIAHDALAATAPETMEGARNE